MGIDPDDTFTYWLPDDASKPEAERRGLVYLHNTVRHWRQFSRDRETAISTGTLDSIDEALIELAGRGLVRMINLDSLESLRSKDLIDLTGSLRHHAWLCDLEKKDSPSPAPSAGENSAKSASPASA